MPLAEHDLTRIGYAVQQGIVSIHVPLAEHDHRDFQSVIELNVSIHVPLAEHDQIKYKKPDKPEVSIHVPLAEHDCQPFDISRSCSRFQFTCPSRSTTLTRCSFQ